MSKKIKIPSINIKCHLSDLFHSFIRKRYEAESRRMSLYDEMDDEDLMWLMQQQGYIFDDDINNYINDDNEIDVIWPPKSQKKPQKKHKRSADDIYDEFWNHEKRNGKRKHSKHKSARLIDINQPYSGDEEDPDEVGYAPYEEVGDDGIFEGKEIYYYPDYHHKENRLEFGSLKSFNDFCADNGYKVPEHVANDIMYRRVSHACLRPDAREYGLYEITAEESYGVLVYEVCDSSELGNL